MRNPWGIERYTCDYSDDSELWTQDLKREAGATAETNNDGLFFMTIDAYKEQGLATLVSFDTDGWYNDYFLMLDDNTGENGSWSWCGETCTRHEITISSAVAQEVYVTAFTWEKRSYPEECQKTNKVHSIYMVDDFTVYTFKDGARQMSVIDFEAGESKSFIVEWDWAREDVTPDWSVTAWAELGQVSVSHNDDIETDSLPFTPRRDPYDGSSGDNSNTYDGTYLPAPEIGAIDEMQIHLNDFVMDFDIQSQPGYCGFRLREDYDEVLGQFKSVAAHNCYGYGVNLTLYMLPADWDRIEKSFYVKDNGGKVMYENHMTECNNENNFRTCKFYLSPSNPRMGLLMDKGSYGLMTYAAQWVLEQTQ